MFFNFLYLILSCSYHDLFGPWAMNLEQSHHFYPSIFDLLSHDYWQFAVWQYDGEPNSERHPISL